MSAGEIVVRRTELPDGEPFEWINQSGLPDERVLGSVREIASQVSQWMNNQRAVGQKSSMFNRTQYAVPDNPYSQMHAARSAVENDDIIGGVADTTEAMMFDGQKFEGPDEDDADIFNQIAALWNLDEFSRKAHRELYTCSQMYVAEWWGYRTFRVRGTTVPSEDDVPSDAITMDPMADPATQAAQEAIVADQKAKARKGRPRRRTYDLYLPVRLAVLDSTKIVPVGPTPFGYDRFAWQATKSEAEAWDVVAEGMRVDPIMSNLFIGRYQPTVDEKSWMAALGIDHENLIELNPARVWRHTYTKQDYKPFPDIRLKGCFSWLDLKQQQMEADRAMLVGAANYILLIKKGNDQTPAHPEELSNLKEGFKVLAKLPVIVSDHRLDIEIITPALDNTLDQARYDTIDRRLMGRALGALSIASSGQRNENTLTISRFIGRLLESRRHMLKRAIEERLVRAVTQDPTNARFFKSDPSLAFIPQKIELGTDNSIVTMITSARASRDLSRESFLEFLGYDQEVEAQRMAKEAVRFDGIFKTQVPFNGADPNGGDTSQSNGMQGGRPAGGGAPPANAANPKQPNATPEKS